MGQMAHRSEALAQQCEELEEALAHLKTSYEQYFLGMERLPPARAHGQLKEKISRLRNSNARQTAVKFRVQSLFSKYLAYERLWTRTLQEIENGSYRRDLFKAKLHSGVRPSAAAATPPDPVAKPAPDRAEPPPILPKPVDASAAPSPTLSEERLRKVYTAYIAAKKQCKEDVSKLTYEAVASRMREQVSDLLTQHKANSVDFKVVIKDGKVVLRAVSK